MNISKVENPRLVIWMKKNNLAEVPKIFGDYMAFISANVDKYCKENNFSCIIDHDDFTSWLSKNG